MSAKLVFFFYSAIMNQCISFFLYQRINGCNLCIVSALTLQGIALFTSLMFIFHNLYLLFYFPFDVFFEFLKKVIAESTTKSFLPTETHCIAKLLIKSNACFGPVPSVSNSSAHIKK